MLFQVSNGLEYLVGVQFRAGVVRQVALKLVKCFIAALILQLRVIAGHR